MSARGWVPAPLAAEDPARARALNAKIRDRVSDVRRHLRALRAVMGEFGEDFDPDLFTAAYASEDPVELNRVKAVERGVEQLYGFIAELMAFGLELAGLRGRREETDTPAELDSLVSAGVLSARLARRLKRLYDLQRMLTGEHVSAEHVHESAVIAAETLADFYDAYGAWVKRGFAPSR